MTSQIYIDIGGPRNNIFVNKNGDSFEGALNMSGNAITGLPPPLNAPDAASKNYVDAIISASASTKLSTYGGTLFGNLSMEGTNKMTDMADPTADKDAATKAYVDREILIASQAHTCDIYSVRLVLHDTTSRELPLVAMWPPRFSSQPAANSTKILLTPGMWELSVTGDCINMSIRLGIKMQEPIGPIETVCAHDVENFFDFRACLHIESNKELKLDAKKEFGDADELKLCLKITRL